MGTASKIIGIEPSAIAKIDGVAIANAAKIGGQTIETFSNTYCLEFDGASGWVDCGQDSSILTATFTVSCWINADTFAAPWYYIIGCDAYYGTNKGWRLWSGGTNISFSPGGGGALSEFPISGNINTGTWYQLIAICDGAGNSEIFLNGVSMNTGNFTAAYDASIKFIIGSRNANSGGVPAVDAFDGKIDEVAIWDTDQSTKVAEIYGGGSPVDLSNLASAPAPTAWWRMGDAGTFAGGNWTIPDQIGSEDGTSANLGIGDRVTPGA